MKDTALYRVLLGWANSRWYWWPWHRWVPSPEVSLPRSWLVVHAVSGFVWFGFPFWLVLRGMTGLWLWSALLLPGGMGAIAGLLWCAMVRSAWNRRALEHARARGAGMPVVLPGRPTWLDRLTMEMLVWTSVLVISASVIWSLENIRGTRALRRFEAELRAKGVPVTPKDLAPPAVPDDQNLALAPVFRWMLDFERKPIEGSPGRTQVVWADPEGRGRREALWNIQAKSPTFEAFRVEQRRKQVQATKEKLPPMEGLGTWLDGESVDLALWQAYYRSLADWLPPGAAGSPGKDVLLALERIEPELQELRAACKERPVCRFPLRYEDGFGMLIPHLAHLKKIATALRLRAVALLAEGRSEEALADVLLGIRMRDALGDEPILISALVRIAIDTLMLQPVWEGCRDHRWSDAQLARLQEAFGAPDYLREIRHALDGERVLVGPAYEVLAASGLLSCLRGQPNAFSDLVGNDGGDDPVTGMLNLAVRIMPRGWVRQNQVEHGRCLRGLVEDLEGARSHRDLPPPDARVERLVHGSDPFLFIAKMLVPAVGRVSDRSYGMEAHRRLALAGLALERYRRSTGDYPADLAALVPRYLPEVPQDPMVGEPLRYERLSKDEFRLFSVGHDGREDGGVRGDRRARSATDRGGPKDLVWQ